MSLEMENMLLQEELNEQNQKYYAEFLSEIRVKSLFKANKGAEEMSLVVLQDILEAQSNGVLAEDYFGENAKSLADSISKELSFDFKVLDMLLYLFVYLTVYMIGCGIFTFLGFGEKMIDLVQIGVTLLIFCTMEFFRYSMLGKRAYYVNHFLRKYFILLSYGILLISLSLNLVFVKSSILISGTVSFYFVGAAICLGLFVLVFFIYRNVYTTRY